MFTHRRVEMHSTSSPNCRAAAARSIRGDR